MSTETIDEVIVDTFVETFTEIWDLPDLPCEHGSHAEAHRPVDSPAVWRAHLSCPGCGLSRKLLLCEPGYQWFLTPDGVFYCHVCNHYAPGTHFLKAVYPL